MTEEPLVFISHKHADEKIASAVSRFITDVSLGKVKVFQSSNNSFEGPRFGVNVNKELRNALWDCDVLLLIYTTADRDWAYCMWECGVATQPNSPDTKTIVFQCGSDTPSVFQADLRVNVHNADDLKKFTKQLLTDTHIFGSKGPLAKDIPEATLNKHSADLQVALKAVIPDMPNQDEWSTWPYLQIEVPYTEKDLLNGRVTLTKDQVQNNAVIIFVDIKASQLFRLINFSGRSRLTELKRNWEESFPGSEYEWFDSICEQVITAAKKVSPVIRLSSIKDPAANSEFTPVLSKVSRLPFGNVLLFDFHFYNLSDPRAIPVITKMIKTENFFYKEIGHEGPISIRLRDLLTELKSKTLNRVPLLSVERYPIAIAHKSVLDAFIADNIDGKNGISPGNFTLNDLFADDEIQSFLKSTFCVVSKKATLADAKTAMLAIPRCSDVFITETGKENEPVVGWLTNVDMAKYT